MRWCALVAVLTAIVVADDHPLAKLERSYWLHASLASQPQRGYWGANFPAASTPSEKEIQNAARLLASHYAANRLYLIYHNEISPDDAERIFTMWRRRCPAEIELVPMLVLRAYDKQRSEVFPAETLHRLAVFFKRTINPTRLAIYDVHPKRDQGEGLALLAKEFPGGLVRVGLQPDERLVAPFVASVQDTWSGFCQGKTNEDWLAPGFGAQTLRQWVARRNTGPPVSWDLIAVAWDYAATPRGAYPGYDDAAKNMPLPTGRNLLAAKQILRDVKRGQLSGFSSDLFILHVNSRHAAHDGEHGAFYETLKRGEIYRGYYTGPLQEIAAIFDSLKRGQIVNAVPMLPAR